MQTRMIISAAAAFAVLALSATPAQSLVPPPRTTAQPELITHDWTTQIPGPAQELPEFWADVKTPGDGLIYAFGTITVHTARDGDLFSQNPCYLSYGMAPWGLTPVVARQITILQVSHQASGAIQWQRYLFGQSPNDASHSTNARGISVWPASDPITGQPDPQNTRIAVCGETYDQTFPPTHADIYPQYGNEPSGFFAVYDGNGVLLWSQRFYLVHPQAIYESCAVTDVCIRVENSDHTGTETDVVTYCGLSSHGQPLAATFGALIPVHPHARPSTTQPGYVPGRGDDDNGPGNWDGFVGRFTNAHAVPTPGLQTKIFHSVVGGSGQDGLFGLAEIDADRFVAVGSTALLGLPVNAAFPFTGVGPTSPPWMTPSYCVGTASTFAFDRGSQQLSLIDSVAVGRCASTKHSIARDIYIAGDALMPSPMQGLGLLAIVGSTDDSLLFSSPELSTISPVNPYASSTEGFLVVGEPVSPGGGGATIFHYGTFVGKASRDGLVGVAGWNEFADYICVTGFTEESANTYNITVSNWVLDASSSPAHLVPLRQSDDLQWAYMQHPAVMGGMSATHQFGGLAFNDFSLGSTAGGGISVDKQGNVHVVGATNGLGVPGIAGRGYAGGWDGLRLHTNLLPPNTERYEFIGVESTTPRRALAPFGVRLAETCHVLPDLPRMLLTYDGADPAPGATPSILVTRPPSNSSLLATYLQVGPPSTGPTILPNGVEFWLGNSPVGYFSVPSGSTTRFTLAALPPSYPPMSLTIAAQLVCVLATPIPGGSPGSGGTSTVAASPAIYFTW